MFALLTSVFAVVLALLWWVWPRRPFQGPPGPQPWPIIGNLFQLLDSRYLIKWQKQYGDIYSAFTGFELTFVLASQKAIAEAFVKQPTIFGERNYRGIFQLVDPKRQGLMFAKYSNDLMERKKYTLSALKAHGFGTRKGEEGIHEELKVLCEFIEESHGAPIDLQEQLGLFSTRIICRLLFGLDERSKEKTMKLFQDFGRMFSLFETPVDSFPTLKYFPPFRGHIKQLKSVIDDVFGFIYDQIDNFLETADGDSSGSFIASLAHHLGGIDVCRSSSGRERLAYVMFDFMPDGCDTLPSQLRYDLLYLASYPDVQEKVYAEVEKNIGTGRLPCLEDRLSLPYLESVVLEVLRLTFPVTFPLLFRRTTADTELLGYKVPKGTLIDPDYPRVFRNPEVFKNPDVFEPERFMENDCHLKKSNIFFPFSVGQRMCAGQRDVKCASFLVLATLLQRFRFSLPAGQEAPPLTQLGVTMVLKPTDFLLQCSPR